jgi:hypothetical protein
MRKISPSPGFDPRTFQPVASRYSGYATRLLLNTFIIFKKIYDDEWVKCEDLKGGGFGLSGFATAEITVRN